MYNKQFTNLQKSIKNLSYCKLYQMNVQNISTKLDNVDSITIKLYIRTTLNNMFITVVTPTQTLTKTLSAFGFKGKSKQTTYAYKMFAEDNIQLLKSLLLQNTHYNHKIDIYANPLNSKLKIFLKLYKSQAFIINKIYDLTPIPYNGCKKKKIAIKKKKKSVIKFLSYR